MIRLDNINKIYNKGRKNEFHALIDINLHIYPGEMIALTGKSGAGKSTLLNILACMDRPDSGIYYWYDQPVGRFSEKRMARMRNEKIGIVVQDFALIEDFTVYENVSLPMEIAGRKRSGRRDRIQEVLHIVGMESVRSGNYPADRNKGLPLQEQSLTSRILFWRTNPRARWIPIIPKWLCSFLKT